MLRGGHPPLYQWILSTPPTVWGQVRGWQIDGPPSTPTPHPRPLPFRFTIDMIVQMIPICFCHDIYYLSTFKQLFIKTKKIMLLMKRVYTMCNTHAK